MIWTKISPFIVDGITFFAKYLEVSFFFPIFAENNKLMRRRLFIFSGVVCLMVASIQASPMLMEMEMGVAEQVEQERVISIDVDGNKVDVKGANGMVLEVISITGRQVASYKIDSPAQRVELGVPKGCYILKIGKVVRKITVR
jgi:hypothetical protein